MEVSRDKVEIVTVNGTSIVSCTSDDDSKSVGSYQSGTNCLDEDFDQVGSLRPSRFSCFIRVSYSELPCGATRLRNKCYSAQKWQRNAFTMHCVGLGCNFRRTVAKARTKKKNCMSRNCSEKKTPKERSGFLVHFCVKHFLIRWTNSSGNLVQDKKICNVIHLFQNISQTVEPA